MEDNKVKVFTLFGINFTVRLKNLTFWLSILGSTVVYMATMVGVNLETLTTFPALLQFLKECVTNPVVIVGVLGFVYNAVIDFTTKGLGDSDHAKSYTKPYSQNSEKENNK